MVLNSHCQRANMVFTRPRRSSYSAKWDILFNKKISEWIAFKPQLGLKVYPCYACRHMFSSKNSFLDHVNRRGILLKYICSFCSPTESLTFYNPCSLLLHTRQHYSLVSGQVNLDNLEVSVLPFGMAGFLPDPNIPMLYDVEEDNVGETTFINTRFYNPISENLGNKIVTLLPNELLFFYSPTPTSSSVSLVLKQLSSNIPLCQFVTLDMNRFAPIPNGVDINGKDLTVSEFSDIIKEETKFIPSDNFKIPVITKVETLHESDDEAAITSNSSKVNKENLPHCPECGKVQNTSMSEHFLCENKPANESFKCSICKYVAPTRCSLKAHERIHESVAPYVCPECGKDFKNWKELHTHMDDVCFHLAKQVRSRCPGKKCGKVFAQTVTYCAHFTVHMQCLNKCIVCNSAFFNEMEFLEHAKIHENNHMPQKVYKCAVCTNSKTYTEENFQDHISWHATNRNQYMYVYICKYCRSYFRSTFTYASHLLRCSKLVNHVNPDLQPPQETAISQKLEFKPQMKTHQIFTTCSNCDNRVHFKVQDLNNVPTNCVHCGAKLSLPSKDTICQDTQPEIQLKQHGNNNCSPKLHYDLESGKSVTCRLCRNVMSIEEMSDHFNLKRCKFHAPIVVLDSALPTDSLEKHESVSPQTDESNKKKRKRNYFGKNKRLSAVNSEVDLDLSVEEPTPFDGTYHCKVCGYSKEERVDFQAHIRIHRDVSTSYQCMECGECFVVKPSLLKHLCYYHQICDTEEYLNKNDCFDKEAVKELEEVMKLVPGQSREPVAENQCKVCREQFNDARQLSLHFRVHGMAFLLQHSK